MEYDLDNRAVFKERHILEGGYKLGDLVIPFNKADIAIVTKVDTFGRIMGWRKLNWPT